MEGTVRRERKHGLMESGPHRTFRREWLELRADGQLKWRTKDRSGSATSSVAVAGCSVSVPKQARKGHEFCVRVDLAAPDSAGETKYVFAASSAEQQRRWMVEIGHASLAGKSLSRLNVSDTAKSIRSLNLLDRDGKNIAEAFEKQRINGLKLIEMDEAALGAVLAKPAHVREVLKHIEELRRRREPSAAEPAPAPAAGGPPPLKKSGPPPLKKSAPPPLKKAPPPLASSAAGSAGQPALSLELDGSARGGMRADPPSPSRLSRVEGAVLDALTTDDDSRVARLRALFAVARVSESDAQHAEPAPKLGDKGQPGLGSEQVSQWMREARGSAPSEAALGHAMTEMDTNGDGVVDFDEFCTYLDSPRAETKLVNNLEGKVGGILANLETKARTSTPRERQAVRRWSPRSSLLDSSILQGSPLARQDSPLDSPGQARRQQRKLQRQGSWSSRREVGKLGQWAPAADEQPPPQEPTVGRADVEEGEPPVSPRVGAGKSWKAIAGGLAWPAGYSQVNKLRSMFEVADADGDEEVTKGDVRVFMRAARGSEPSAEEVSAVSAEMASHAVAEPAKVTEEVFHKWVEATTRQELVTEIEDIALQIVRHKLAAGCDDPDADEERAIGKVGKWAPAVGAVVAQQRVVGRLQISEPVEEAAPRVGSGKTWRSVAHALVWPHGTSKVNQLRSMFEVADADGDGVITKGDVKQFMRATEGSGAPRPEPAEAEVAAVVSEMDEAAGALSSGAGVAQTGFEKWVETTPRQDLVAQIEDAAIENAIQTAALPAVPGSASWDEAVQAVTTPQLMSAAGVASPGRLGQWTPTTELAVTEQRTVGRLQVPAVADQSSYDHPLLQRWRAAARSVAKSQPEAPPSPQAAEAEPEAASEDEVLAGRAMRPYVRGMDPSAPSSAASDGAESQGDEGRLSGRPIRPYVRGPDGDESTADEAPGSPLGSAVSYRRPLLSSSCAADEEVGFSVKGTEDGLEERRRHRDERSHRWRSAAQAVTAANRLRKGPSHEAGDDVSTSDSLLGRSVRFGTPRLGSEEEDASGSGRLVGSAIRPYVGVRSTTSAVAEEEEQGQHAGSAGGPSAAAQSWRRAVAKVNAGLFWSSLATADDDEAVVSAENFEVVDAISHAVTRWKKVATVVAATAALGSGARPEAEDAEEADDGNPTPRLTAIAQQQRTPRDLAGATEPSSPRPPTSSSELPRMAAYDPSASARHAVATAAAEREAKLRSTMLHTASPRTLDPSLVISDAQKRRDEAEQRRDRRRGAVEDSIQIARSTSPVAASEWVLGEWEASTIAEPEKKLCFRDLMECAETGDEARLLQCLAAGVDPNEASGQRTALQRAAERGHDGCCCHLLGAGARVDAANSAGFTALYLAAGNGHAKAVRTLVAAGCNLFDAEKGDKGGSAAAAAARHGGHDSVARFIEASKAAAQATAAAETADAHPSTPVATLAETPGSADRSASFRGTDSSASAARLVDRPLRFQSSGWQPLPQATALRIDRAQVRRQGHNLVSVVGTKGAKASRIEDLLSSTGGAPSTARGESRLAGLREAGKAAREGKGSEETGPITQWYSRRVDREK